MFLYVLYVLACLFILRLGAGLLRGAARAVSREGVTPGVTPSRTCAVRCLADVRCLGRCAVSVVVLRCTCFVLRVFFCARASRAFVSRPRRERRTSRADAARACVRPSSRDSDGRMDACRGGSRPLWTVVRGADVVVLRTWFRLGAETGPGQAPGWFGLRGTGCVNFTN